MKHLIKTIIVVIALIAVSEAFGTKPRKVEYSDALARKIFQYSKISYCDADKIQTWKCGSDCDKLPGMKDITVHSDSKAGT